jgi:hypothetical protein
MSRKAINLKTFVTVSLLIALCLIVLQATGLFQRIDLACYGVPDVVQNRPPFAFDGIIAIVLFSLFPGLGVIRWRIQPALVATFIALVGYYLACWAFFAWLGQTLPVVAPFAAALLGIIRSFGYHPQIDVARFSKGKAFISYRRDHGAEIARLIRSELSRRGIQAYLDVDGLKASHFDDQLLEEISGSESFILILNQGSLDRCNHEDDWLRREIAHAIRSGKKVLPVVAPGFTFPPRESLPPEIADLPRYQAVLYSHEFFSATMDKLMEFLLEDPSGRKNRG